MAGWTLWQALPPRYQLTCKDINGDDEGLNSSGSCPPTTAGSPRQTTPRRRSATSRVKHAEGLAKPRSATSRGKTSQEISNSGGITLRGRSADLSSMNAGNSKIDSANTSDKNVAEKTKSHSQSAEVSASPRGRPSMYFSVTSPRIKSAEFDQKVIAQTSFPPRRSSFINTFKNQQLINSMRETFEDPSTVSPRTVKRPFKAPTFPVTQFNSDSANNSSDCGSRRKASPKPRAKTAVSRKEKSETRDSNSADVLTAQRNQRKSAGTERQQNIFVNTIVPFENSTKPFLRNPLYYDKPSRRYVVRKLDDATMFIDDDKIIFIRKKTTKNDILQCQKTIENTHYLAHLRKLYLRQPRDMAKFMQTPETNKKSLIKERLEYDKKTDNILNYYSRIDDRENAFAWAMSLTNTGLSKDVQSGCRSARAQSSPGMRRDASPSKAQTPTADRPATSRSFRHVDDCDVYNNHDALSDWNVFVKFNSQSILHERQFYLQTPMVNPEPSLDQQQVKAEKQDGCECRLCRLEMEIRNQKSQDALEAVGEALPINNIKTTKGDTVVVNSSVKTKKEIKDEIKIIAPREEETVSIPVNSKNPKVDKSTSTDDRLNEKATINLTIDLSIQTMDPTETNVASSKENDCKTHLINKNSEIDSTYSIFDKVKEDSKFDVKFSDRRGQEDLKETRGGVERGSLNADVIPDEANRLDVESINQWQT